LSFARRTVFDQFGLACACRVLVGVVAPAKGSALVDRVQGVDDQRTARDRQSAGNRALAESIEDRRLALAGEASFGDPPRKLGRMRRIHRRWFRASTTGSFGADRGPPDNTGEEQVDFAAWLNSLGRARRRRRSPGPTSTMPLPISKIPSEQGIFAGLTGNSRSQKPFHAS